MDRNYDVIIVGGGPAGLSAALVLGRCRRKILVCDSGKPRNLKAEHMHGYLTRDGFEPLEFLRIGRAELKKYGVRVQQVEIISARMISDGFELKANGNITLRCRKLLLCTGVQDRLPDIPEIYEYYGKSVHHCPYCDGWENKNKKIAVYAKGKAASAVAFSLKTWTHDVVIISDGPNRISDEDKKLLDKAGIKIFENKIRELQGRAGYLKKIIFQDGSSINRDAIFFSTGQIQKSDLAKQLGIKFSKEGLIYFNRMQMTNVDGVYAAGDACRDVKFVIVAAAEGAKAAIAINIAFQEEEKALLLNSD